MKTATTEAKQTTLSLVHTNYSEMEDAQLVLLCQKQDQAAFDVLIKRHQRNLHAMLYKLAPDWNDTADLAQEACIRIWKGIGKLQNPKAFKSWMGQIVTNLFYDELRKRPRQTVIMSLDAPMGDDEDSPTRDLADPAAGPDEIYARKDLRKTVDAAISTLPRQFRTAIILREVEDLPYDEIAEITQTDIGTVKSRISRARTKVQNILRPQFRTEKTA
ncbi:MAG: sigma-70 family RNA polymerase sigma factor [Candidatus Melainabacteria bacterium]|nr:sigma-70 family RNA polymerase sigma factor [Candidatus Melainabacteria bacterium]